MTFAVRRARQQTPRLLLMLLAGLIVVLGVGGMEVLADRFVDDGVRQVAARAEPATRAATVSALRGADPKAQDRAVRSAIGAAFGGAPVAVSRLAVSDIALGTPDAVQAMSGTDATAQGVLVDGAWPARAGEAAVLAAAAERRGWRIGDRIALGADAEGATVEVAVVGIWQAKDPADPVWVGDPAVASGDSGGAAGPVLVTDADLDRLWTMPTVTWSIRPAALSASSLDAYRAGLARLAGLPESVDPDSRSSTATGGSLGDLLDRTTRAVTVTRGTMIVPAAIIVLLGAIAIVVILTALAAARQEELRLLRARGAALRGIAAESALEAAIAAGSGAVIALLVLLPFGARPAAVIAAGLTVLVAAGAAAVAAARGSAPAATTRSDAGRGVLMALLLPAAVAVPAAGFALWQLLARGGVLGPDGSADPVASASGAVSLLALTLLVPALAVLCAAVAERLARRGRGIMPVLPLRQIARRAGISAVAILCVALAAGAVTLAAGAGPLAQAADRADLRAGLGMDVRLTADAQGALPLSAADARALPWVTAATAVLDRDAEVGADRVAFIALDPGTPALPAGVRAALERRAGEELPIAITSALAGRLGAAEGARFTVTLRPEGIAIPAQVVAVVPTLPGIGPGLGVLADRTPALKAAEVPENGLWIATADPAAVAAQIRARAAAPVRILTPGSVSVAPITGVSVLLLAIGSVAAALLGLLAFLAAVAADRARRTEERLALRALGLSPARQRSARVGEVLGIASFGALGGVAAGLAVTAVVLPVMWGAGS